MKISIVRIGNSRGIRIPKAVFDQCGFGEEVELEVQGKNLVLSDPRKPRQGWEAAFAAGATQGKDVPLDPPTPTAFEEEEWAW